MTNGIPIGDLAKRSHENAVSKGWYETWPDGSTKSHAINVPEKLALIHSEVSEALEAFRVFGVRRRCWHRSDEPCSCRDGMAEWWPDDEAAGKPEGFVVELADAVIRIADLCGALGLDLAEAIELKHAYNTTRPFRHGGKLA